MKKENLLDHLCQAVQCNYISDFKFRDETIDVRLCAALDSIDPADWPASDWCELFDYLFGSDPPHRESLQIRADIMDALRA